MGDAAKQLKILNGTAFGREISLPSWDRYELIVALDVYFQTNFGHPSQPINAGSQAILDLSSALNHLPHHPDRSEAGHHRSASAAYMKLKNFMSLDPEGIGVGLTNTGPLDEGVWMQFANDRHLSFVANAIRNGANIEQAGGVAPDAAGGAFDALEGRTLMRFHRTRERNRTLVERHLSIARELGELRCEVCNFAFHERYGEIGEGFIECHHTVPVSQMSPNQRTQLGDLALVCANCHRMLHRGGAAMTVEILRHIIGEQ